LRTSSVLYGLVRALVACAVAFSAQAGEVIDGVKSRGKLRCGVSDGIPGFSALDAKGRWTGLDADFCRAVAAAVLGDPEKVQFVPLKSSERFPALIAKAVDLLVRNTTWTMRREVLLKVSFPGILYYDGQGFMVSAASGVKSLDELKGATICVEKGTTHEEQVGDWFAARNAKVELIVVDSSAEVAKAFFSGKCRAYSSDASQLAAVRTQAPGGAQAFVILPELISKEPLAPAVRRDDADWVRLVRWVLFSLIAAEEGGITRANAKSAVAQARGAAMRRIAEYQARYGKALGARDDWFVQAVQAAGNYGEMFERNVGAESALKLERGPNRLWNRGGLMYAPPL
jgi:general L-amino acid transport system substrate-binding protein